MSNAEKLNRIVSILVRTKAGVLKVDANRQSVACDDNGSGITKAVDVHKKDGATMVMVLGEDDSVLRHWTKPEEKKE